MDSRRTQVEYACITDAYIYYTILSGCAKIQMGTQTNKHTDKQSNKHIIDSHIHTGGICLTSRVV